MEVEEQVCCRVEAVALEGAMEREFDVCLWPVIDRQRQMSDGDGKRS